MIPLADGSGATEAARERGGGVRRGTSAAAQSAFVMALVAAGAELAARQARFTKWIPRRQRGESLEAGVLRTFKGHYDQLARHAGGLWGVDNGARRICRILLANAP